MLRKRNKKNLIIGLLCTLLLFMGTGYAVMMQIGRRLFTGI